MALSLKQRTYAVVAAIAAAFATLAAPAPPASSLPPVSAILDPALTAAGVTAPVTASVIVRGADAGSVAEAVRRSGGRVERVLPIVDGVAAVVDPAALASLARDAAVSQIAANRSVHLNDAGDGGTPPTPTSVYPQVLGADQVWSAGYTGKGVTVAVIDTGIANVPDLAGRIVPVVVNDLTGATEPCINFSGEAGCADSYGHGTFVAGMVAASGATSNGLYKGVAPKAKVLSVKLAGRDGAADVSTLLAALQWVVSHKDRYGIRVVNLSLGSDSPQSYLIDPLNYAVEKAWNAGIVVVVAASNRGPTPGTITKPADDPWVVTVGAVDDRGTVELGDDLLPNFTGRGPTLSDQLVKPDLVAPGAHVVSLRAPGSAIDENFPTYVDAYHRKGSGTSFATPTVAGTVALMLQRDPSLTPDRVKHALMSTARETASSSPFDVGAGIADAYAATFTAPEGLANQGLLQSDGTGSIDASRGTLRALDTTTGLAIEGVLTQQGLVWSQVQFLDPIWNELTWSTSQWTGANWHGANWHGANWHGANWHGANWHGANWHGVEDDSQSYGQGWLGSAIYGAWE